MNCGAIVLTLRSMDGSCDAPLLGVDGFWRSDRDGAPAMERVFPSGQGQVIVDLDTRVGTLVGPRTVSAIVSPPRHSMGFTLTGSGLAHIVGGDAHQLVDAALDLGELDGNLLDAPGSSDGLALRVLAGRLVQRFEVDNRVVVAEQLIRSGVSASLVMLQLGCDRRTFVPAFRRLVGVAPKHYERLRRMQAANIVLRSRSDISLATIAADLGFSDQPHMAREVRQLTGYTPHEIRHLPREHVNHAPVEVALT